MKAARVAMTVAVAAASAAAAAPMASAVRVLHATTIAAYLVED